MKFFVDLGEQIQAEWRKADCSEAALPEIALAALRARPPAEHVNIDDCLAFGFAPKRLPIQVFGDDSFGQPGLVTYSDGRFCIALLFWLDSTTSIHDHSFAGAFHVLAGSSLHTSFTFEARRTINEHTLLGSLQESLVEVLRQGDSRAIHNAGGTIHQLFHLDHPSVSVVIRTLRTDSARPQFAYFRPDLAHNIDYDKVEIAKRTKLLRLVHATRPERLEEYCRSWLDTADFTTAFVGLRECALLMPAEEADVFLDGFAAYRRDLIDCVRSVVEDDRRSTFFLRKRATVKDRDLRFILAVLLNVRGREKVLRLLREQVPSKEPVQFIVESLRTLTRSSEGAPILQLELNDVVVSVIESLFRGASLSDVAREVEKTVGRVLTAKQETEVADLVDAIKHSELFRHALSDA